MGFKQQLQLVLVLEQLSYHKLWSVFKTVAASQGFSCTLLRCYVCCLGTLVEGWIKCKTMISLTLKGGSISITIHLVACLTVPSNNNIPMVLFVYIKATGSIPVYGEWYTGYDALLLDVVKI